MAAPYSPEAFVDIPDLRSPKVSPKTGYIAFLWNKTGRRELYAASVNGGNPEQLTHGDLQGEIEEPGPWDVNGEALVCITMDVITIPLHAQNGSVLTAVVSRYSIMAVIYIRLAMTDGMSTWASIRSIAMT